MDNSVGQYKHLLLRQHYDDDGGACGAYGGGGGDGVYVGRVLVLRRLLN